jgi:BolA family transcriptional regulator, general stress-responsive regulator
MAENKAMPIRATIIDKLNQTFTPNLLEVIDESEKHRGHAGWREGGGTHFKINIASAQLAALSRLEQHRAINSCLKGEFDAGVHAISINVQPADPTR